MARINIYYCLVSNQEYLVTYDDVTHTVIDRNAPVESVSCSSPVVAGDVIYTQTVSNGKYFVKADPSATRYWATVEFQADNQSCNASISSVDIENESVAGAADGKITVTSVPTSGLEFRLDEEVLPI